MYLASLVLGAVVGAVEGHGYPKIPRSRALRAAEEDATLVSNFNGLNRKATADNTYGSGLCGVPNLFEDINFDTFLNGVWKSEATYTNGGEIDVTTVISAYHGGHIEIGACADESPTQDCFDANKLTYIGGGHPKDEAYPLRAYLGDWAMSYVNEEFEYKHRFRLPAGLHGDRVLLQWRYMTASACKYEGYEEYFAPYGGYAPSDGVPLCDMSKIDNTGITAPERFWSCMEVSISEDVNPDHLDPPDPSESHMFPLSAPQNCGGGYVGNGACANDEECCSSSGWCGVCSPTPPPGPSLPPPNPTPPPPSPTSPPPSPTPPPPSPTSPPPSPNPDDSPHCCSWGYDVCGGSHWCDESSSNCQACAGQWILA